MGIIVVLGLCLIFFPIIILISYIITHTRKKTSFDKHLEIVKSKKGLFGVIIAYLSKILLGLSISLLGFYMSEELDNEYALKYLIISLVFYIIVRYFDKRNKR